jgi:hypothetical protein
MMPVSKDNRIQLACGHVVWRGEYFESFYWSMVKEAQANGWPCPLCRAQKEVHVHTG